MAAFTISTYEILIGQEANQVFITQNASLLDNNPNVRTLYDQTEKDSRKLFYEYKSNGLLISINNEPFLLYTNFPLVKLKNNPDIFIAEIDDNGTIVFDYLCLER